MKGGEGDEVVELHTNSASLVVTKGEATVESLLEDLADMSKAEWD